jgi:hypothetical protein
MITLWKANELSKNDPLAKFALPEGFPFLVVETDESIEIQEHVLLYLYEKFARGKGRRGWKKNTAEAYAYDLRDWFAFLEVCEDEIEENSRAGKPWDAATEDDYINYREALQDAVSPHTRQYLSHSTIRRRQSTVENFYKEAQRRDWYVGTFLKTSGFKKGRIRPADRDAMVHLRAGRDNTREVSPYVEETKRPSSSLHHVRASRVPTRRECAGQHCDGRTQRASNIQPRAFDAAGTNWYEQYRRVATAWQQLTVLGVLRSTRP